MGRFRWAPSLSEKSRQNLRMAGRRAFVLILLFHIICTKALLPAIPRFCLLFSERHIYQIEWIHILYTSVHFTSVVSPFQICSVVFSVIARHCWETLCTVYLGMYFDWAFYLCLKSDPPRLLISTDELKLKGCKNSVAGAPQSKERMKEVEKKVWDLLGDP